MRRTSVIAAGLLLAGTLLAGCGDDTESDLAAYCETLQQTQSDLADLRSLATSNATVEEVRDQADEVSDGLQELSDQRQHLTSSVADEAEQYFQDFEDAVSSIPGDATLSEAASQYADAARQLDADLASLSNELKC